MKFGVSEAARIFRVDRDLIKIWSCHFSDYLGPGTNPGKGIPRQFSAEDLRVLAYVSMYWEDQPDVESIKIGLNTKSHFEEPFNDLLTSVTPLFQELPENLDESWRHGTVIGGMAEIGDAFALAESYNLAGDMLVDVALSTGEAYELIYPVIYNYRHATELYLKATVVSKEKTHDLLRLLQEFKKLLKAEFDATLPEWFENIVLALVVMKK
jgi:superfamily I DNA/RNA helicase